MDFVGEIGEKEEKEVMSVKLERKKKKEGENMMSVRSWWWGAGEFKERGKREGDEGNEWNFVWIKPHSGSDRDERLGTTIEIEQEIEKLERVQNKGEGGVGGWFGCHVQ